MPHLLLALLLIWPAFSLIGLVLSFRSELGIRSPLTLGAAALFVGAPAAAAICLARGDAATTRQRLGGAQAALHAGGATLGALEIGIRAGRLDPVGTRIWRHEIGARPMAHPDGRGPRCAIRPHAEWGHEYSSNDRGYFDADNTIPYRANSAGFRGPEFQDPRPPHTLRIAILGDSFPFGEGVKDDDVAPRRIERLLREGAA